jgi:hypothetical protein
LKYKYGTYIISLWIGWRSICACFSINKSHLTHVTRNLVDYPRQAKLFLSPPLIDMVDQHPPQTAKESKGVRKYLKKLFGRGSQKTPPTRLNSPPAVVAPPAVQVAAALPTVDAPPADLAPTVSTIMTDPEEAAKLRAKYKHFHILVIRRANAGKTTLLKRVCNSREDPVYSEVRCPLRLIPHSDHPFTNRLPRPQRCQLGDLCVYL